MPNVHGPPQSSQPGEGFNYNFPLQFHLGERRPFSREARAYFGISFSVYQASGCQSLVPDLAVTLLAVR